MRKITRESDVLPEYPRIRHLPYKPNAQTGDLLAADDEVSVILSSPNVYIEEKVDGANCGVALWGAGNHFIVRNRTHILSKGFVKDTPAKKQFASIWNWLYENKSKFMQLNLLLGFEAAVYAEWLYALHGIVYDNLPDYFVPFELYNPWDGFSLDPGAARCYIEDAGFALPPLLHRGPVESWEHLEALCNEPSPFSTKDRREGIFIKVSDGKRITHRFKMVRQGFTQGCNWNEHELVRNSLKEDK